MGSLAHVNFYNTTLSNACKLVNTTHIYGAALQGENIYTASFSKKCMLVIGSESHGISTENSKLLSKQITIPQAKGSKTESLNAAVATSIILSEVFRQKHFK